MIVQYLVSWVVAVDGGGADRGGDTGRRSGAGGAGGAGSARWITGTGCCCAGTGADAGRGADAGSGEDALAGGCPANPAGAAMGESVPGCSSVIAGTAGACDPGLSAATVESVDDWVGNLVIAASASTSAELATRAITGPRFPDTGPPHRRRLFADPDRGSGAASSSPSWLSAVSVVTGCSMSAAAGGREVTGWKRSAACRAGRRPPGDVFAFTAAIPSLAVPRLPTAISHLPCSAEYVAHTQIGQSAHAVTPVRRIFEQSAPGAARISGTACPGGRRLMRSTVSDCRPG